MGSTCFGVDTELDRTMTDGPNFSKGRFPHLVAENPDVREAIEIARQELDEDDFNEEYGCIRGGGGGDTFTADLIRGAAHQRPMVSIEDLAKATAYVAAYDVGSGAGRHPAALTVGERFGDQWVQIILEEIRDKSLPEQETFLVEFLTEHPNLVLVVDAQGIGMQIAQALEAKFGTRVIPMHAGSKPDDLEPQDKGEMTLELRRALEASELLIAPDRELARQLHRTKLAKTIGGNRTVEQRGSKKRTHYDKYWATAYLQYGIRQGRRQSVYEKRGLIVVGG